MKYRVAVCDDDEMFLRKMNTILTSYLIATDYEFEYSLFNNGKELLERSNDQEFQIFFLDIEMAPDNGIELAKKIKKAQRMAYIIFISNYPEYMGESFGVHPYGYLTKNCNDSAITGLLDEIFAEINDRLAICSVRRTDGIWENVIIREIIYIEVYDAKKEYIQFIFKDRKLIAKGTVKEWENRLTRYNFVTCYKGILINVLHIHYFSGNEITMVNGERLPVSRINEKIIKHKYIKNIVEII